jgi:hypothetical protein
MDAVAHLRKTLLNRFRSSALGDRLIERLCRITGLPRSEVIFALGALRDSGEVQCSDWFQGEPVGRVLLAITQSRSEVEQLWEAVLLKQGVSEIDRKALIGLAGKLEGLAENDLIRLVSGLAALRIDLPQLRGQPRYHVSAKYLLGSSKLLDTLPTAVLRSYGIDTGGLTGPSSYVITAGPANPECVVLVENPQAMELALQAEGGERCAWVATFGYGLSRAGDEYGLQLAGLIEQGGELTGLVRQGSPPSVDMLLRHSQLYFWGDLDREGLRIYWRMKSKLPQLQLSALYIPMREMITNGAQHHPYTQLVAKPNQGVWQCTDPVVQRLLDLCSLQAVDQESLNADAIRAYGHFPYD